MKISIHVSELKYLKLYATSLKSCQITILPYIFQNLVTYLDVSDESFDKSKVVPQAKSCAKTATGTGYRLIDACIT